MQVNKTIGVSAASSVECPTVEDVVVLVDDAGVALGVQGVFSAAVGRVRDGGGGFIASKRVDIPVVGSDGEISGILCRTSLRSDPREAAAAGGREEVWAIADVAQFIVHDINNLLAVIGSGLRLLEEQEEVAYRKAIIGKMQEAITRGALHSRQLLDAARPRPKSIDGFVEGSHLAAIAGTLDRALRPNIAARTEIARDLWAFSADPEELYFALLNLCRNSADAMPDGGTITVAARNVEPSAGAARGFVEIVVADGGEGMPDEVLSQAFTPYFTTKAAGNGTGLGLAQVRHFAEGRGGVVCVESERGAGTLVRLFLPRAHAAHLPSSVVATAVAYASNGGVFHVINQRQPRRHRSLPEIAMTAACSPHRFFLRSPGPPCSGERRTRSLSKRCRGVPVCST